MPDELLDVRHGDRPQSEVDYRAAWSRTYLKKLGLVENTSRGVWRITEAGRRSREADLRDTVRQLRAKASEPPPGVNPDYRKLNKQVRAKEQPRDTRPDPGDADRDWKDSLLAIVRQISTDAFERLCQRVLRESGFVKVEVIGRWRYRWRGCTACQFAFISRSFSVQPLLWHGQPA